MNGHVKPLFFAALILFWALSAANAQEPQNLWVSSKNADLKAGPSVSSETISELSRGTALAVESIESRWYQVTTESGQTGWIYRGKVSETQPEITETSEDQGPGLGDLLGGLTGSSVEAQSADSARSIRGLSPEAKAYADKTGTPHQSRIALDRVLSMSVTESEIESFLEKGRIGEYAE